MTCLNNMSGGSTHSITTFSCETVPGSNSGELEAWACYVAAVCSLGQRYFVILYHIVQYKQVCWWYTNVQVPLFIVNAAVAVVRTSTSRKQRYLRVGPRGGEANNIQVRAMLDDTIRNLWFGFLRTLWPTLCTTCFHCFTQCARWKIVCRTAVFFSMQVY